MAILLLGCRKLSLMHHAHAAADTFVVGKQGSDNGSDKLREVWNGGLLIEAVLNSDKPLLQACRGLSGTLGRSDDRPLLISTCDGRV